MRLVVLIGMTLATMLVETKEDVLLTALTENAHLMGFMAKNKK